MGFSMIQGLLTVCLLAAFQQPAPPQAPSTTYKVSGTVVREDKQDPAAAAQANQIRIQGPMTSVVVIRAGGNFEFANIRPGTYQLVVGPRITMAPVTVVVSDKDLSDVRVVVPLSKDVTGNVTVDGGGPHPRFQVTFNRVDVIQNPVTIIGTATFNVALPLGQYRVTTSGLPAGYNVKSIMLGNIDALNQPITVTAAATPVLTVALGVSSPPPWVKVSGRVTGGTARNVSMNGPAVVDALNTEVGADGAFEFPMVLPGIYTVRIVPAIALAPATPVTVGSTNVTNVELRIPATKEVTGRIVVRGDAPIPRLMFSLLPIGAPVTPAQGNLSVVNGVVVSTPAGSVSVPANPGPDGEFKVTLPDGDRQIAILPASIPAGYKVESFAYGATDLLQNPLHIALSDMSEIAVAVDATQVRLHNISGKITGLLTTQGVRVVLQGGNLGTGEESPVAHDGSFAFAGILPGNYSARLSLSGEVSATSVNVGSSDVTDLRITYPRRFHVLAQVLVEGDTADVPNVPPIVLEGRSSAGVVAASSAVSDIPGIMLLTVSDGEHKISVRNVPAGYALKSMRYGAVDLQKEPLKVDGPITWEIVVRLARTER
jgi:hypothetical protein